MNKTVVVRGDINVGFHLQLCHFRDQLISLNCTKRDYLKWIIPFANKYIFEAQMVFKEANGLMPPQIRPTRDDYSSTNGSSGRMKVEVSQN